MGVKKKAKIEPTAAAPHAEPTPSDHGVNTKYMSDLQADLDVIFQKWPTVAIQSPLPVVGDSGFMKLLGFGVPFECKVF